MDGMDLGEGWGYRRWCLSGQLRRREVSQSSISHLLGQLAGKTLAPAGKLRQMQRSHGAKSFSKLQHPFSPFEVVWATFLPTVLVSSPDNIAPPFDLSGFGLSPGARVPGTRRALLHDAGRFATERPASWRRHCADKWRARDMRSSARETESAHEDSRYLPQHTNITSSISFRSSPQQSTTTSEFRLWPCPVFTFVGAWYSSPSNIVSPPPKTAPVSLGLRRHGVCTHICGNNPASFRSSWRPICSPHNQTSPPRRSGPQFNLEDRE